MLGRRAQIIVAAGVALVVAGLALGWLGGRSRRALLAIRDGMRPGMCHAEVMALVGTQAPGHVQEDGDTILVHESGVGWILVIALREGKAAGVCVRSYDSILRRPRSAPADLVWEAGAADDHPFCPGALERAGAEDGGAAQRADAPVGALS